MKDTQNNTLRVPGATLFYEVRGSGPLLLLIAGGGGGSAGFKGLASYLADFYTIVTYDRRGNLRSPLDDPAQDVSIETHSDDAHRLLNALTSEPALVFGSSAGALIGLDLVIHHPEQVRTLVAHEPPVHYLLPDRGQPQENALEIYQRGDKLGAFRQFAAQAGMNYANREPGVNLAYTPQESTANADAFFKYTYRAVGRYRLDFPTLLATPTQTIIAGGSAGKEFIGYRSATVVAERLGTTVVEFPSDHVGYMTHPRAFATRLHDVLAKKHEQ